MAEFRDLPLEKVLRILLPTFESMEIKCLALKQGEQYHNVASTVFFGYETPTKVQSGLDTWRQQVRADSLEKEGLKLFGEVRPVRNLDHFLNDVRQGFLSVDNGALKVPLQPKTSTMLDQPVYRRDPARAVAGFRWVAAHVDLNEEVKKRLPLAHISPSRLGLETMRQAGPTFLDADIFDTLSELMIFVPIYLDVLWPPTLEGRRIVWKVHGHSDLMARTRFWALRALYNPRGPVVERIELPLLPSRQGFGVADLACQFEFLEANNSVTLLMVHEDLDQIGTSSIPTMGQYLQVQRETLAVALHTFHAWQRIREFLSSPQSHRNLFEPAVHWIFTLLGWQGFQLSLDKKGASEVLEEDFGRQTKLSSDMMLLSPQNKLVVFSLTSSLKDVPVKAQGIKNAADRLSHVLNLSVAFAVIVSDVIDILRPTLKPVPLIGLAELAELWQAVEAGYVDRGNAILAKLLEG